MEQLLIKLGLADKEAKVYVALLELAEDTVQNIAQKAGVNRATTYVILDKLMKHGLASQVKKGKKTFFVAEDPHELANILEAQKQEIEVRRRLLDDSMNQFVAVYNAQKGKPTVRYFEGEDGLESLDRYGRDFVATGEDGPVQYSLSPIHLLEELFPTRRAKSLSERISKGQWTRLIYTHANGPFSDQQNKEQLREAIYLSPDQLPMNMTVSILKWGAKFFYLSKSNPRGVLIEDADIARNLRVVFDLAWEGAKVRDRQSKRS